MKIPVFLAGLIALAVSGSGCGIFRPLKFNNFGNLEKFEPDPAFGTSVSPPAEGRKRLTPEQIFKSINVAHIEVVGRTATGVYWGTEPVRAQLSGFVVLHNGRPHILTAGHIDQPAFEIARIYVSFQDPELRPQEAELLVTDPFVDFALLRFKDPEFNYNGPVPPLGSVTELNEGEPIYALGSPLGSAYSIKEGIVSNITQRRYILHSATLNPGNSGGPLVNQYGEVIGINIGGFRGFQALNPFVTTEPIASPIDDVITVLRRVEKPGVIRHPSFRFGVADSHELHAFDFEHELEVPRPDREGVIVMQAGNGLEVGDIILSCNRVPIADDWQLIKKLKLEHSPGDEVLLRIYRYGRELDLNVRLEPPDN